MRDQPDHGPEQERIARAHEAAGRFAEAARGWAALAAERPFGAERAAALTQQARLLGPSDQATALLRRALVDDPSNADAIEALADRARDAGSWLLLANLERLRFAREQRARARADIALRAGRLELERLRSPGAARDWFHDGLECDPDHRELLQALVDLERSRGDEAALLVSLERLIELRGDAAPVSELMEGAALRVARGEPARALGHLERASARRPDDGFVLEALADVLGSLERLPELADVLERRAAIAADDPALRAGVLAELGTLLEERMFDPDAALDAFERACAADPRAKHGAEAVARLRAKRAAGAGPGGRARAAADPRASADARGAASARAGAATSPAAPLPAASPAAPGDDPIARLEREARSTTDRARLAQLAREIESLQRQRGSPERALPWVQRWALTSPEDPEALRALARIHGRPGRETELSATLEALDPLLDLEEQAANRRKLAALYHARGRIDDAVRACERALSLEPRDLETLEQIQALLRERGDRRALVPVLRRILELREPRLRPAGLVEIAQIQEESGDLTGAIATRIQLEEQGEAPPDVEERLDALLERAGRHAEIEGRLRRRRERFEDGSSEMVAIELRRAQLLLSPLGRPEEAAEAFRCVLIHAPESPDAKTGLERSLRSSIDASALADFLAEQARSESDPGARDRAAFERAVLLEEELDRIPDAREAYRALARDATDPELRGDASHRYDRLLQRSGEWHTLRQHLEASLGSSDPAREAALHERLARLCAEQLRDDAGELRNLERVVELDPSRVDVWRALADRYEREGRSDDQIRALERELAAGADPARRLTLHARLAELTLYARRDPAAAREHYERVFEIDPSHAAAAYFLIERYDHDRRPEDVIRILEARLAASLDAEAEDDAARVHRAALRVHLANVRASQQNDVEGAISALEVALSEVGPTAQVAEPLAACYQRAGYPLDLIELARSAAAACAEPAEAANWYVRMGDAFLSLEKPREAADAYRQALSERPDDRAVQASLRAIYRKLGQTGPLAGLLDAELSHLAGPSEVPVRMELARLQAGPLARPHDALVHVKRVLQLVPRHAEAFALALELTAGASRQEAALELVDARLEHAATLDERAELLARRAELLAGPLGRPDAAIEALRASLAAAPDADRRQRLAELLEQCARTAEWLEVTGELAREASGERRAALIERAARAAWERLTPDSALPWLERLAALRPGDVEVRLRIAQAHRLAGRTESLLRALSDALACTSDPIQRRNLQLERAALLEIELSAPARALAALMKALEASPSDAEVLGRLERLQGALGRHADRAETLAALLAVSPEDALELHGELARLWDGPLFDPSRAALHWRAALSAAPGGGRAHTEILRSLAATWRRAGELERWAEAAEEELAALDPQPVFDDRRRELHRELTLGYHLELARPGAALRHARALLDAGSDEALSGGTLDRIEAIALELLRQADAPVELEARLTRHLARRPADAELWFELARLRDERLQATGAAIEAYRRVCELDPTCLPALRGLRTSAERLGRWRDVADALERELDHPDTASPELRSGLLRRLGDLYWHRLQSTTRASRCYAGALEVNGADFGALRSLERLLEAMEDWRGALDLYESEVEVLADADPQRRREIWLHVAELARDRTDDVERARRALRHAARIAPLEPKHLRELAELHARAGDEAAFAETFAAWCDDPGVTPTPEDELRLALCLERLARAQDALRHVLRSTAGDPATPDAWDAEARLREALGDEIGAADALCSAAARAPDREAAERLLRASRLIEPRDSARALELLRRAVARDPAAAAAQADRARIALRSGALLEAEEAAAAALDLDADALGASERLSIAMVGGDAARAAGRLEAAAGFYAQAYACDPRDARATGAYGETLAALGDTARARQALEARLSAGDAYPERAAHRATLAACLEAEHAPEQALAAALAALADDPHQEGALGICVRVHETLGHVDEAVEATLRWAAASATPALRAQRLLRAAEWEIRSGEREASAEAHLREALAADAGLTTAWIVLISLLTGQGRFEEAIECANRAATHAPGDADLGLLALLQGRACEQRGDRAGAAEAFGVALEAEPRCSESALARARLLRGAGDWRAAAEALQKFLDRHPEPDHPDLGPVHEQLGRLLAGPLEDVGSAIRHYRRAIALTPEPLAARAALAELLSHREGDRQEALVHLRPVLDANPTDAASLRVALRLARANPAGAGVPIGIEVLRALGVASTYERDEVRGTPELVLAPVLDDPRFELLRGVASLAADAIAEALEASEATAAAVAEGPEAAFRAALLRREGLLAAPALVPLPTREVACVLELVVRLVSDGEAVRGDGRLVNALSSALGRRLRRRLRKHLADASIDALCAVDFDAFRVELRALAAGLAIADTGCGLRTALVCLARDEDDALDAELREQANLAPRVAASPAARALLRRLVSAWLERI